MAVGMVVEQAARRARAGGRCRDPSRSRASTSALRQAGIAVRVEQALLGGDGEAGAVDVDRAALQHPVVRGGRRGRALSASRRPIVSSPGSSYLPPQPLKRKRAAAPAAGALEDDRPGVAQPDVAERLVDDGRERRQPRAPPRPRPDRRRPAAPPRPRRRHGPRARRRRPRRCAGLEIVLPQLGMARKADPDEVVRRPFGRLARGHRRYWPARERSRMARNSSPWSQFGQSSLVASSRPTR